MTQEEMLLEAAQTGFFYFLLLDMSYKLNDFAYFGYFGAVSDICWISILNAEIMNLRNLERVLAREEEVKKRAIVHKPEYTGPQIRYFSKDG